MIKQRRYRQLSDFQTVYEFLARCYETDWRNGVPPTFWEYGQTFGTYDGYHSHRIGLWEDDGALVALAAYEVDLGEAYFVVDPLYTSLAGELIAYAERELRDKDGKLTLMLMSTQTALRNAASGAGYKKEDSWMEYDYFFKNGDLPYKLPEGYRFLDNAYEEADVVKLDACLHYGFDHEGEPDGDLDFRLHMAASPHFRPDLTAIAVEEATGEYAAYAGMYVVPERGLAYLEPLCTRPEHRRRGLAAALIAELVRRTRPLGATHITGGANIFYPSIGYEYVYDQEIWGIASGEKR